MNTEGRVEVAIKEKATILTEVRLSPKYLNKYYNYGRNAVKINGAGAIVIFVDENRDLIVLNAKVQNSLSILKFQSKFSNLLNNLSIFDVKKLAGADFKSDTLCSDGHSLYCLASNGTIVKVQLHHKSQENLQITNLTSTQLHVASHKFNSIVVHLNMLIAASFSVSAKSCRLSLLDTDLKLKDSIAFDCRDPCQVMHIGMHGHLPVLTVLTAAMAIKCFMVINSRLVALPCRFESLQALNEYYQERSPLSFSSPFARSSKLLERDDLNPYGAR